MQETIINFLKQIEQEPENLFLREIFGDYLEENGYDRNDAFGSPLPVKYDDMGVFQIIRLSDPIGTGHGNGGENGWGEGSGTGDGLGYGIANNI